MQGERDGPKTAKVIFTSFIARQLQNKKKNKKGKKNHSVQENNKNGKKKLQNLKI